LTTAMYYGSNGNYYLSGGSLAVGSLDNRGGFYQTGGSLVINYGLQNTGSLTLAGATINGTSSFVNSAQFTQGDGTVVLANTGANQNLGTMDLASGRQFQVLGGGVTLGNAGAINLNGGTITGSGNLANQAAGIITGHGNISTAAFSNDGTLALTDGLTTVAPAFTNTGQVLLSSNTAVLGGGTITNSGSARIVGFGSINNAVTNTGRIEAAGGTLTLAGGLTNVGGGSGGTLQADTGAILRIAGSGMPNNSAKIRMEGGTVATGSATLTNDAGAVISGYGTLRTGGLTNNGQVLLAGGVSNVYGSVTSNNASQIVLSGNSNTTFYGPVDIKSGAELRVSTGSVATFFALVNQRTGSLFTGSGSKFYEGGLAVGASPGLGIDGGDVTFGSGNTYFEEIGGLTAGTGFDAYHVAGALTFGGTLKLTSWNGYVAQAGDRFDIFDWGTESGSFATIDSSSFLLAAGTRLDYSELYTSGVISVQAVPEPETYAMLLAGLGLLGAVARRRGCHG